MDKHADGFWRVFDGERFKFYLNSKKEAYERAVKLGGIAIGLAKWNEDLEQIEYRNVERIGVRNEY